MPSSLDRIFGSLIGLIFADAVGSRFEGMQQDQLRSKFKDKFAAFENALNRQELQYTDDGQMTLAIAEHLADNPTIVSNDLMRRFVDVYESWRGYGRGARVLIEAFRDNAEYEFMAEHLFPGGSLGNGAAMRSAPIGLRFVGDVTRIWQEAKNSAWPTHRHELGIEGAQLIAVATSIAASKSPINPLILAEELLPLCSTVVFQNRLERLRVVKADEDIEQFGNGIEAHESVVTALACFALYPCDYQIAISTAIWQGGDTDTIAAMTGALVGAHVGSGFSKDLPLKRLEEGDEFIGFVRALSTRLADCES
ncbi:ADP-ribosylglycohydrolase family protein [Pirellulaceae bacterium SH449]